MATKKSNQKEEQKSVDNTRISGVAGMLFGLFLAIAIIGAIVLSSVGAGDIAIAAFVFVFGSIGIYMLFAVKVANQWEKAVVLRFGKFLGLYGPGLFWIIPIIDSVAD